MNLKKHKVKEPILPHIDPKTRKGKYGKILVVGRSQDYYGAPLLTALGAENSGADLLTVCVPSEHVQTAKNYSLNFFLKSFEKSFLTESDVENILEYSKNAHVAVMGNGLGKDSATQKAVVEILKHISIPVVLDAEALFPEILNVKLSRKTESLDWILTPHVKEFERLFETDFSIETMKEKASEYGLTLLVKGPADYVSAPNIFYKSHTGCVQMRVGGTGDVLAGIVASYRSQGLNSVQAAQAAVYYYGKAGTCLAKKRKSFSALHLAEFFCIK